MKSLGRSIFVSVVGLVVIFGLVGAVYAANPYPNKPIELIVPFAPGGDTDLISRVWADAIEKELGVPLVVINKAGGSGVVASTYVANAKPDGYTLLTSCFGPNILTPQITKTKYNLESFTPICLLNTLPLGLVVSVDSKFKKFDDFIKAAKAAPGKLTVGSYGSASWGTIATKIWTKSLGISVKMVEHSGGAPALVSVLGGHIDSAISLPPIYESHVKAGKAKILVSAEKLKNAPNVPTFADYGVKGKLIIWNGIFAPAGTPEDVQKKLIEATKTIFKKPEVVGAVKKMGSEVAFEFGAEWGKSLKNQYDALETVIEVKEKK
jgi:tripartite-type tricarboxylate transporter receptor subunit TctC